MGKHRTLICSVVCLCFIFGASAQNSKFRKAARLMERLRYEEAIDIYEKILEKEESAVALRRLGIAYRKIHRYDDAENAFAQLTQTEEAQAADYFYHGMTLLHSGRCAEAQSIFKQFLLRKPYDERRPYLEDACRWYNNLKNGKSERHQVELPSFNSIGSDIGPAFFGEQLVFGSVRAKDKKSAFFYDLYTVNLPQVNEESGRAIAYDSVKLFPKTSVDFGNEAIISFDRNLSEMYLTRNGAMSSSEEIRRLEIVSSQRNPDGSWGELNSMPFNNDQYSVAHPAISPDGERLFFSSDMPGGFGGKDIYVCHRIGEEWGPPVNLGPMVNTEADELYPFYHESGELYFSSDGHFGIGGQDIFKAEDLGLGNWSRPANLGAPLNSPQDDFGIILSSNSTSGYFTSNRPGGAGRDDIYRFSPRKVFLEVQVNSESAIDASAILIYHNDKIIELDDWGHYGSFVDWNECGQIRLSQAGYQAVKKDYCARDSETDSLVVQLDLIKTEVAPTFEDTPVNLVGQIFDRLSQEPVANAQIRILSETGQSLPIQLKTRSDDAGNFRLILQESGCYQLQFLKDGYFTLTTQDAICNTGEAKIINMTDTYLLPYRVSDDQGEVSLNDKGLGDKKADFVASESKPGEDGSIAFQLNVYYDLGRASVRPEAIPELQKLRELLKDNPDIILEISSHTDSQGGANYNQQLSQRRANAIVRYLVKRDISEERLEPMGYGESKPVNKCVDGVECSEKEHQRNRRTEFRVIGRLSDRKGS